MQNPGLQGITKENSKKGIGVENTKPFGSYVKERTSPHPQRHWLPETLNPKPPQRHWLRL